MATATHTLVKDQRRAARESKARQDSENHGATTIETQDSGKEPGYVIYVYNVLNREHLVSQPPIFPGVIIPACEPHKKFAFTQLPAFVKEPYFKPGSTEMYYKNVDGRKAATSLLNPSAFPGTNWNSQTQIWPAEDQFGNNLNAFGVWWSLTKPDEEEKLAKEIKIFKDRVQKTMQELVADGETKAAAGDLKSITPWMHFAMDYLGKSAPWHMPAHHMITCPNCGAPVKEGIAYHKNDFGERCIVDIERYKQMLANKRAVEGEEADPETAVAAPARTAKKKAAATAKT